MPEGLSIFGFKITSKFGGAPPSGGAVPPRGIARKQPTVEKRWNAPNLSDHAPSRISVCNGVSCVSAEQIPIWLLVDLRNNGYHDRDLLDAPPRHYTARDLEAAWSYYETHRSEIDELIARNNRNTNPRIRKIPGAWRGAACIAHTRIAVWLLVHWQKAGKSESEIIESYSHLICSEDIKAAWEYYENHEEEIDFAFKRNERVHDY